MEPATALGLAAGIRSVVVVVSKSIATLNATRFKYSEGDLRAELLIGQLHTVRTALTQVQEFIDESDLPYRSQLATDLRAAVEHCRLLVQHIDHQISFLDKSPHDLHTASSKAKMLVEERVLRDNMMLLNSQISALNLCLTAYRCRTRSLPAQLSEDNIVELPNADDALRLEESPSIKLANSYMKYSTQINLPLLSRSRSHSPPVATRKFDFDWIFQRCRARVVEGRPVSRADSEGSRESCPNSSTTLKNTMLKLSNAIAHSSRVDQAIKRDSVPKEKQLRLLALGQSPSTTVKRIRFALSDPPTLDEIEKTRRRIVPFVIRELLSLSASSQDNLLTNENMKRLGYVHDLESFLAKAGPEWSVSPAVYEAAQSIWSSSHVQTGIKNITRPVTSTYFLKALQRVLNPVYSPSITDITKIHEEENSITETTFIVNGIHVNLIDAPQPKLHRFIRPYEDADAFLFCLDLSTYNQYTEHSQENDIERALSAFKRACRSSKQTTKAVLILMYNAAVFRRKLPLIPFHEHFEGCPKNVRTSDESIAWLLKQFLTKLHSTQPVLHHCAEDDTEDDSTIAFFKNSVGELPNLLICARAIEELVGDGPSSLRAARNSHH